MGFHVWCHIEHSFHLDTNTKYASYPAFVSSIISLRYFTPFQWGIRKQGDTAAFEGDSLYFYDRSASFRLNIKIKTGASILYSDFALYIRKQPAFCHPLLKHPVWSRRSVFTSLSPLYGIKSYFVLRSGKFLSCANILATQLAFLQRPVFHMATLYFSVNFNICDKPVQAVYKRARFIFSSTIFNAPRP